MQPLIESLVTLVVSLQALAATLTPAQQVEMLVEKYGAEFKVPTSTLNAVIQCESGGKQEARGKAGEVGTAQFMPSTFAWFSKEYGQPLDIHNQEHQIKLMAWAFSTGKANHWTCFRRLQK